MTYAAVKIGDSVQSRRASGRGGSRRWARRPCAGAATRAPGWSENLAREARFSDHYGAAVAGARASASPHAGEPRRARGTSSLTPRDRPPRRRPPAAVADGHALPGDLRARRLGDLARPSAAVAADARLVEALALTLEAGELVLGIAEEDPAAADALDHPEPRQAAEGGRDRRAAGADQAGKRVVRDPERQADAVGADA